jgi:hypothetical protein
MNWKLMLEITLKIDKGASMAVLVWYFDYITH